MLTDWKKADIQLPGAAHEFAIGDVHGLCAPFKRMLEAMGRESDGTGHLTQLGDINDRGPDTIGSYRAFFGPTPEEMGFAGRTGLIGNHEAFMLGALLPEFRASQFDCFHLWLGNGGEDVLAELGLDALSPLPNIRKALRAALGDVAFDRLCGVETHRRTGNLLLVHAGIRPGVPLDDWFAQPKVVHRTEDHYTWIREPFFKHVGQYDGNLLVVHGHTAEVYIQDLKQHPAMNGRHRIDGWRLGLDGGSYNSGIIAGAEFKNGAYRVYTERD